MKIYGIPWYGTTSGFEYAMRCIRYFVLPCVSVSAVYGLRRYGISSQLAAAARRAGAGAGAGRRPSRSARHFYSVFTQTSEVDFVTHRPDERGVISRLSKIVT